VIATIEYTVFALLAIAWLWIAVDIAAEKFSEWQMRRRYRRERDAMEEKILYWQKYDQQYSQKRIRSE
jgi:hypothetical protein